MKIGKRKYFYYSEKDLKYKELRFFKTKVTSIIFGSVILLFSSIYLTNFYIFDFLNIGYDRINKIIEENKTLKTQINTVTEKINELRGDLYHLNTQGDDFRLLVDLPKLDQDEKKVGIGGDILKFDVKDLINNNNSVFAQLDGVVDQLTREIDLQKDSYNKILNKYKYNQKLFSSIPALKPIDGYYSVRGFGIRMHPVLGMYRTHQGLDIIADVGTPIYSSGDGSVEFAGRSGGGYGIVVVINHGFGYQSLYAHLSKVNVRQGQKIKRGDLIAKSGRTGLVSGPHLHYEVIYKGIRKNPVDYFFDDLSPREYNKYFAQK